MGSHRAKPDRKSEAAVRAEPALRGTLWPAEFASPRAAILSLLALGLFTALIFTLAYFDGLRGTKVALAWALGVSNPAVVQPGSWDLAVVLWAGALVLSAGIVHPGLGIIVLAVFRPWLDGYMYTTDNFYFVWGIMFLAALWGARMLTRGDSVRHGAPTLLLAAFCAVAVAGSGGSIQFDRSYRHIILWFSYLAVFFVMCNSLRTRKGTSVMLAGLTVMMAAQSWFSILHFRYILPFLRSALISDPMLRQQYYGDTVLTPELVDRLNLNRAFGSLLFPNTLAGFLILGIPYAVLGGLFGWRALAARWRDTPPIPRGADPRNRALAVAAVVWLVCAAAIFITSLFPITYTETPSAEFMVYIMAGVSALAALFPAGFAGWLANRRGLAICGHTLWVAGLSMLAVIELCALALTYSRGGMLALLAAAIFTGLLVAGGSRPGMLPKWLRPAARLTITSALLLGAAWWVCGSGVWAQPFAPEANTAPIAALPQAPGAPGPDNSAGLIEAGTRVTMERFLNPATMGLRWSYWRVGVSMFLDHFWTGVGLGAFGVAYPGYQYLGASDVSQAHNSYLQAFCETGLAGGLLLIAFCAHFVWWGARRILRERDQTERRILIGLYAGVLAFLLHAFIDIHFVHPSLVMIWMAFAGLFYARGGLLQDAESAPDAATPGRLLPQIAAIPLLLLVALTVGMSLRVYLQDLSISRMSFINVAKTDELTKRYQTARYLLYDVSRYASDPKSHPQPRIPIQALTTLISDPKTINMLGTVFAPLPDTPKGARRVQPGEIIPDDALLVIAKPWWAYNQARTAALDWTRELERYDRRFPYSPDLSMHLCEWYKMLLDTVARQQHPDVYELAMAKLVEWSEEGVRRSPAHADMHVNLAQSLWRRAKSQPAENRLPDFERALSEFRQAALLTPVIPAYLTQYADALRSVGEAIKEAGDAARAGQYLAQADEEAARLEQLRKDRAALGLP